MKKIINLRLCFFVMLFAQPIFAHSKQAAEDVASIVNNTIEPWMKSHEVPGVAVGVYRHGKPSAYYFGVESRQTNHLINEKTTFEVGSLTKLFTCLLAAEMANEKQWSLDDPVVKYLPVLKKNPAFQSITLKNLGTYTAGFPFTTPETIQTQSELSDYFNQWKPEGKNVWIYSNISIGVLGDAVAARMHQDINDLYRERILKPLGMEPIGLVVPESLDKHYAQGYDADGEAIPRGAFKFFASAGGAKMSAGDAIKLLKASLHISGVDSEIVKAMKVTQTPYVDVANDHTQGLGWVIYPLKYPLSRHTRDELLNPDEEMNRGPIPAKVIPLSQQKFNGSALMDKTGATYGFRSYIVVIPNLKTGVVILVNRYVSNGEIIKIGRDILLKILDDGVY